jgi:hypothetical protein
VPGAAAPWIDLGPPAQYASGGTGAPGPARSPDDIQLAGLRLPNPAPMLMQDQANTVGVHYSVAGTIVLALVVVFVLQQLGFRFVVAAGVGR